LRLRLAVTTPIGRAMRQMIGVLADYAERAIMQSREPAAAQARGITASTISNFSVESSRR
jgi:hypothetical protein